MSLRSAKLREKVENNLMRLPGVSGVSHENDALKLYVSSYQHKKAMPNKMKVDNQLVEVKKEVIGTLYALKDRTDRIRPVLGGISTGNTEISAGTLGVVDRNNKMLSNAHVLALGCNGFCEEGTPIWQPGCFSSDTRVLTEDGLKYFNELTKEDKIMTLNSVGEIDYQKPSKIHEYNYKGNMVKFDGRAYNLLVTPNHQLLVENKHNHNREFITAEDFIEGSRKIYRAAKRLQQKYGNKWKKIGGLLGVNPSTIRAWCYYGHKKTISHRTHKFIKHGEWNCVDTNYFHIPNADDPRSKRIGKIDMETWLDFFGRWISEGSLGNGYRIHITNYDREFIDKCKKLMEMMGLTPYINDKGIQAPSKALWLYLKQFGHAHKKYIPKQLKELPPKKLKILLSALVEGDGTVDNRSKKYVGEPREYASTSWQLANDVLEIGLKCGYGVSIGKRSPTGGYTNGKLISGRKPIYRVGFYKRDLTPEITKKPEVVSYDGRVYDVTVPNSTLMIERNGTLCWSGNSYDGGSSEDVVGKLEDWVDIVFNDKEAKNYIDGAVGSLSANSKKMVVLAEDNESDYEVGTDETPVVALLFAGSDVITVVSPIKYAVNKLGVDVGVTDEVEIGDTVAKSGRTTAWRENEVKDTGVSVKVCYDRPCNNWAVFRDQIMVNNPFSDAGDSGSLVFKPRSEPQPMGGGIAMAALAASLILGWTYEQGWWRWP